jgi:hypothetical protein
MKSIVLGLLGLGAGLVGGAWSARGELAGLREQAARLRRDLDRARKSRTAADLAMVARIGQARACPPIPAAPPAPAPAAPPPRGGAPAVPPPPPAAPTGDAPDFPFTAEDRQRVFDEFAADLALSSDQQQAVRKVGGDFQRALEEKLGGFLAQIAMAEATGETPRPRDVVRASDELLHAYLSADDRLRALLDEEQVEALDDGEFDLVMLVDFAAFEGIADRARVQP